MGFTVVLLWATAMETLSQSMIGVPAPFLTDDLGVPRVQLGLLATYLFVVAAVFSPAR